MKRDIFSCINEQNSIEFSKILPLHRNDPQGFAKTKEPQRKQQKKKPNTSIFVRYEWTRGLTFSKLLVGIG